MCSTCLLSALLLVLQMGPLTASAQPVRHPASSWAAPEVFSEPFYLGCQVCHHHSRGPARVGLAGAAGPSRGPVAVTPSGSRPPGQPIDPAACIALLSRCPLPVLLPSSRNTSFLAPKTALAQRISALHLTHISASLLPFGLFNNRMQTREFSPPLLHFYIPFGLFLKSSVSFLANLPPLSTNTAPGTPRFHRSEHRNDTWVFTALLAHQSN